MEIEKLSEQNHWESINSPANTTEKPTKKSNKIFKIFTYSYSAKLLWDVILTKYIKKDRNCTVLEVGSAPGYNLVKWHNYFSHTPYGVEYTKSGIEVNRNLFKANNLNPEHIIEADFLSEQFLNKYSEKFDFVYSMGFIEHFDDPVKIIENHLKILKKGGILFISIPNLLGLYNIILKNFYPEILKIHNLEIMEKDNYMKLFKVQKDLEFLYFDYSGTIDLNILQFGKYKFLSKVAHYFQMILNIFCKVFFGKKGFETRFASPYLVFVGRKI